MFEVFDSGMLGGTRHDTLVMAIKPLQSWHQHNFWTHVGCECLPQRWELLIHKLTVNYKALAHIISPITVVLLTNHPIMCHRAVAASKWALLKTQPKQCATVPPQTQEQNTISKLPIWWCYSDNNQITVAWCTGYVSLAAEKQRPFERRYCTVCVDKERHKMIGSGFDVPVIGVSEIHWNEQNQ